MTTVSQLITDSFRQSNLLALGVSPTALQQTEALRFLNRLVKSVFGNEAGDPLTSFPIGRSGIQQPSGYPWYDTVPSNDWFVPKNIRVMLNLEQTVKLYLHPDPDDGSRFAAIDVAGTLDIYPATIYGNGRTIEGLDNITLNLSKTDTEWFYRGDLGDWLKTSPLELVDVFPFPEEFDDFFITMLSIRLNPSYGAQLDPQSQMVLQRSRSQLRSRYTQEIQAPSELGLIRPAKVDAMRDQWANPYGVTSPTAAFNKGWPW